MGDALPGDVPRSPARWGMLRMEGGRFTVDRDEVDAFAALTRARFDAHGALLDRVTVWREQLRYAWTWLAPVADLGGDHLVAVESAVSRVCGALGDSLRRDIEARFLDGETSSLPDAWLHWPLTAGGLGAPYVLADLVPLRMGSAQRERLPVPAAVDDPDDDRAWGRWFAQRRSLPSRARRPSRRRRWPRSRRASSSAASASAAPRRPLATLEVGAAHAGA